MWFVEDHGREDEDEELGESQLDREEKEIREDGQVEYDHSVVCLDYLGFSKEHQVIYKARQSSQLKCKQNPKMDIRSEFN